MDAVKYFEEKERMCKAIKRKCNKCELQHIDFHKHCALISQQNPKETVEIVEKWSKENPQKTILQDFLEKYPNAKTDSKGEPKTCCVNLGYKKYDECDLGNCNSCWNRPLEG